MSAELVSKQAKAIAFVSLSTHKQALEDKFKHSNFLSFFSFNFMFEYLIVLSVDYEEVEEKDGDGRPT